MRAMKGSNNEEIRIIGIGEYSSNLISKLTEQFETISILNKHHSNIENRVIFVMKEFDYTVSQEINSILEYERENLLKFTFAKVSFVVTQVGDKFNEVFARALCNFLSRRGSFVVLLLVIPLGMSVNRYTDYIKDVRESVDIIEITDPDEIISKESSYKINEISEIYTERIEQLLYTLKLILNNGNLLGFNLRDLKEMSGIFGPLRVITIKYGISNFQILERDVKAADSIFKPDYVRRVYVILIYNQNNSVTDALGILKYLKSKYQEVRNAFYRSDDDFGAILIYSLTS